MASNGEAGRKPSTADYAAALVATVVFLPSLATISCLIAYVVRWPDSSALLFGIPIALAVWLLLGFMTRRFVVVDGANPAIYRELCSRLDGLDTQLKAAHAGQELLGEAGPTARTAYVGALGEARAHRDRLAHELGGAGGVR